MPDIIADGRQRAPRTYDELARSGYMMLAERMRKPSEKARQHDTRCFYYRMLGWLMFVVRLLCAK
jgi:hypothetical protein